MGFLLIDIERVSILFKLISKLYENASTKNKSFGKQHEIIEDAILANVILDRLLNHSCIIYREENLYR